MTMTDEGRLTPEQRAIVELPADARTLVTAGAGTGKTFCLIHRLAYLIEDEGLEAADVLVLSFSRAAVKEVKDRLVAHGSYARDVDVRTFDSYATWLLNEVDPGGPWKTVGFDGRIRAAVERIREGEYAAELVGEIRHLVVDEAQDLVQDRADLVKTLLTTIDAGFTLFGDPAQGIYSFQVEDPEERIRGAAGLYEWIEATHRDDLNKESLNDNFRAQSPEAEVALPFGPMLGSVDADFGAIQRDLRTELMDSDGLLGTLQDAAPVLLEMASPMAILCRNNGEALVISRELHRLNMPHRLQRAAQDRVVPKWVASLFLTFDRPRPSRTDVLGLLDTASLGSGVDPEQAWALLKRMDGSPQNQAAVDLAGVRRRLAGGLVPDDLVRQEPARLVVSTIHRVKGLEFDQVVVVDPGDADGDLVEQAEAARTLYVAMTRPRERLMRIDAVTSLAKGRLAKLPNDRWAECGFGRSHYLRFSVEIRGEDVHSQDPAGTIGNAMDPRVVQKYLAVKVASGSPVTLMRLDGTEMPPRYSVDHEGVPLGVTSDKFGHALLRTLKATRGWEVRNWPKTITGVHVDTVETVAGSEAAGKNSGLGEFGVWLRPRLVGLGNFEWKE